MLDVQTPISNAGCDRDISLQLANSAVELRRYAATCGLWSVSPLHRNRTAIARED